MLPFLLNCIQEPACPAASLPVCALLHLACTEDPACEAVICSANQILCYGN